MRDMLYWMSREARGPFAPPAAAPLVQPRQAGFDVGVSLNCPAPVASKATFHLSRDNRRNHDEHICIYGTSGMVRGAVAGLELFCDTWFSDMGDHVAYALRCYDDTAFQSTNIVEELPMRRREERERYFRFGHEPIAPAPPPPVPPPPLRPAAPVQGQSSAGT